MCACITLIFVSEELDIVPYRLKVSLRREGSQKILSFMANINHIGFLVSLFTGHNTLMHLLQGIWNGAQASVSVYGKPEYGTMYISTQHINYWYLVPGTLVVLGVPGSMTEHV